MSANKNRTEAGIRSQTWEFVHLEPNPATAFRVEKIVDGWVTLRRPESPYLIRERVLDFRRGAWLVPVAVVEPKLEP